MNLNHLSDNELIDYVIKHDEDPIRVRLATHMKRVSGSIIDDLEQAGMDDTWCEFTSIVNAGHYLPGQYITHLENEIEYLQDKISDLHKELDNLKTRTVADLIDELNQQIETEKYNVRVARESQRQAEEKAKEATHKLDMWAILQR